ncbi:hypothetical protein [Streptosporangium sp. NPDC023615]|uniref:hypothetical protein n=1 Tax=Streptosporangium sp. NPDC023615 TaxID=3154794 RepID=UPI00343CAB1E
MTSALQHDVGLIEAGHTINVLSDHLHEHRVYPSVSCIDGVVKLHAATVEVSVHRLPGDGALSYRWKDSRRGVDHGEHESPVDDVRAVAGQIAAAIYKTPDEQPAA